ncbi:MAG: DUF134 domain-containing protein [Lachnospiraceae bacterium]|jgi:predicted DNA-binding protein (UPF0251 family)|nr:DUF134 domain-containing protein [Lachnospiraceae bacterium]MDD3617518.1 DUF134 domain-containing protein [Lachnospiraceae bacterium]
MARPAKKRRICEIPQMRGFVPVNPQKTENIEMTLDEYETIRLIDHLGYSQEECAEQMNVARTTVQAIYDGARKKLADVVVNGKGLSIQGGVYELCPKAASCPGKNCHHNDCDGRRCDTCCSGCTNV